MKAINEAHMSARVINEIDEIFKSNIKQKWKGILIRKIIQDWRGA